MHFGINFLLFLGFLWSFGAGQTPSETYTHNAVLDANSDVKIYWKFDSSFITFELHGRTTGWVGVGFSPNGAMTDADIYVGWVKNGMSYVTDRHGLSGNLFPPRDSEQDVEILMGSECDGWTIIKFKRQIAACESSYDREITEDTTKVIWAMGSDDPTGDDITDANYHQMQRGVKSLYLIGSLGGSRAESGTTTTFNFLNDNFMVPSSATYYNCRLFQFPSLASKHHIVQIDPIIQPGNEAYVHHMLLYQCDYSSVSDERNLNQDVQCYSPDMPNDHHCTLVLHAWAVGGGTLYFPTDVGYPIGTSDGPKYVIMETHYDNPLLRSDIVDSSGLAIRYTAELRTHDAGILEVGHTVFPYYQLIPPNANSYLQYGECLNECLAEGMSVVGVSEIRIFGALLHSHLLGNAITLRHIRGETELPYIARDRSYDFNYQEGKLLAGEVVFQSMDSMQLICDYQSTSKENFTLGGLETTNEMCLAYVLYYPKIPIARCVSLPNPQQLYAYFGVTNFSYLAIPTVYGTLDDVFANDLHDTIGNIVNEMTWNQGAAENMSAAVSAMYQIHQCENKTALNNVPSSITPPIAIKSTYTAPNATCDSSAPSMISISSLSCRSVSATDSPAVVLPSTSPKQSGINVVVVSCVMTLLIFKF